jgi:hypothetical protein
MRKERSIDNERVIHPTTKDVEICCGVQDKTTRDTWQIVTERTFEECKSQLQTKDGGGKRGEQNVKQLRRRARREPEQLTQKQTANFLDVINH